MTVVPELTPEQFCDRWPDRTNSENVILLDVRERHELQIAALPDVVHIPMREIPQRHGELDRGTSLVVMCHVGGRSRQVAGFLLALGYENVFNLAGGIAAWSQDIDPQIPVY